ncbi:MAG: DUF882 domain-containing protein [Alphaproteobacteria bacterium]|nr:DUF882 domain-containing protein [Alphaproteobacteria bacterium]
MGLTVVSSQNAMGATERRLSFYMVHTKETIDVVYKRDGKFLPSGLKKLNWFMRDWRRDAPTKMDPAVLDLVWELRTELGSKKPTHVISGYRSLKTNNMLRRIGRRVARRSQHTKGKAIDLVFPDVPLVKLRNSALIKRRGGVGFYPRSGAMGFVHVDTGRVRHWPRMSKKRLASIFRKHRKSPKTKTLWATAQKPRGKKIQSGPVQIASLSAGARNALSSKIAIVAAPKPLSKPLAVIAALENQRVNALALKAQQAALQQQLELLSREDLKIQPVSTNPLKANFATKGDSQLGLRGGRLDDSPLVISPQTAPITTASVAPPEEPTDSFWGLKGTFNFFPLSLFRRDGQPQRFQVNVPNPGQPATGDADNYGTSSARTIPIEVASLGDSVPQQQFRYKLSPNQLAKIASQVVNRNGKTSLIRTRAVQLIRPIARPLSQIELDAKIRSELAAVEAKPLHFE